MEGMRLGKLKSRAREASELVRLSLPGHQAQRGQGRTQGYTARREGLWTPRPHFLLRLCQPASLKCICISTGRQGMAQKGLDRHLGKWS